MTGIRDDRRGHFGVVFAQDAQHGFDIRVSDHVVLAPDAAQRDLHAPDRALGGDNRLGCAILLALARQLIALDGDHAPRRTSARLQDPVPREAVRADQRPLRSDESRPKKMSLSSLV